MKPKSERIDRRVVKVVTREKPVKWPPSFFAFLKHYRTATGPLGKVARFALLDYHCWPEKAKSKDFIWRHISKQHRNLLTGELFSKVPDEFALAEAFRLYYEFIASKRQIPQRVGGTRYLIERTSISPEVYGMLTELCDPDRRPLAITDRPAVIEEAIRAYHTQVFGRKAS